MQTDGGGRNFDRVTNFYLMVKQVVKTFWKYTSVLGSYGIYWKKTVQV